MSTRLQHFAFRIAAVTIALAIVLALAEVTLRSTQARVTADGGATPAEGEAMSPLRYRSANGMRLRPNARVLVEKQPTSGQDVLVETNSLGFRDRELAAVKAENERRVLAIGDSITFGGHLAARDVYVEQVERLLQIAEPELRIEVINAGIGDTGLAEAVDVLAGPGLASLPDVVMVGFYLNDSRPPWGFPGELGAPGWLRRHSVLADTLYRRLKLRAWVRKTGENRFDWVEGLEALAWQSDRDAFRELASLARYDWGAAWEEDSWIVVERELRQIADLSKEHGFPVLLVVFPVAYQVYADFVDDGPQLRVAELANALGFELVDLLPMLRNLEAPKLFYDQCHATAGVNRAMARPIARALRELLP